MLVLLNTLLKSAAFGRVLVLQEEKEPMDHIQMPKPERPTGSG